MKKRKSIAFDVDDTIVPFTEEVLKRLGEDPQSKVEWGFLNFPKEIREGADFLFKDKNFIRNVPLIEEDKLKVFIKDISIDHDVFFVTAIYPEAATERILYLREKFPWIPSGNIITVGNKDIFNFDIFFDDRFENLSGDSKHRILVNKHWNKGFTRLPIVRSLDEMIHYTYSILNDEYDKNELFYHYRSKNLDNKSIVLIQGHTGSGKSTVVNRLIEKYPELNLEKIITTTSRKPRDGEDSKDYHFVSKDSFKEMISNEEFIEYTSYNGNYYGSEKKVVNEIIDRGNRPIVILDEKGIEAYNNFSNNIIDVYIKRDIKKTIEGLFARDNNLERVYKLHEEIKNTHKCRYELSNDGEIDEIVEELYHLINFPQKKKTQ